MSSHSSGLSNINRWLILSLLYAPIFVGCFNASTDGEKVTGIVTVDGEPVERGSIAFKSFDDQAPAGATIREGKYEALVPRGKVKVEIRVPVVIGQNKLYDTPDSPVMDVTRESLPAKYHDQTELVFDVLAGVNNKNWELIGKKKRNQ